MKAMIFAAGRGERLRPLTDKTPKALIEAQGQPLIAHALQACARAGIHDIVINVALQNLGQQIIDTLGDGQAYGVSIQYSIEDDALETGGGIIKALPLLGDKPFVALACDIWSDYDLSQLLPRAAACEVAHMVMVDNPDFHPEGDFHLNPQGVLSQDKAPKLTYAGIGLLHPRLFTGFTVQHIGLAAILKEYIQKGQVTGEHYTGSWMNIGTQRQLQALDETLRQRAS